jgi:hypothetical protein
MTSTIIIGFNNDDRTFELPKSTIQKYPNSILSLYETANTNENIIIEDMTYDQFQIIYDVITGIQKQWEVLQEIFKFMDKYGLINDTLLTMNNNLNDETNEKLAEIDRFLNGYDRLLLTNDSNEYSEYKKIFANDKNIMSVQITCKCYDIIYINILESIPIDYNRVGSLKGINFSDKMDINMMRYKIIIKCIGCLECEICDKCEPSGYVDIHCGNCKLCVDCLEFYDDDDKKMIDLDNNCNNLIYNNNSSIYFKTLHDIILQDDLESIFLKTKSTHENTIIWSDITTPQFTNNIYYSLNKIAKAVLQHHEYIFKYYENVSKKSYNEKINKIIRCKKINRAPYCCDPIYTPITTYYGFVNINNILEYKNRMKSKT